MDLAVDRADALCKSLQSASQNLQNVQRLDRERAASSLAVADCPPVLVIGAISQWPAATRWTLSKLSSRFSASRVRVGLEPGGRPKTIPLHEFVKYTGRNSDGDLEPNYVFEPKLRAPLTHEYDKTVGDLFPHDLLGVLGDETRPPYKWLCLGPRRSGSRAHIDPLATSAWNALLVGKKRWALIDPKVVGKTISRADVQAPNLSPIEWFQKKLPKIRQQCPDAVFEAVQDAGEIMYVPGGVWHAVLNLTDTVAVTHNFVGPFEFEKCCRAVSAERPGLAYDWLLALQRHEPEWGKRAMVLGLGERSSKSMRPKEMLAPSPTRDTPGNVETLAAQLLKERLAGLRRLRLQPIEDATRAAPEWGSNCHQNESGRWVTLSKHCCGDVLFATKAAACVYDDEAPSGRVLSMLAERMPRNSSTSKLLTSWGLSAKSSNEDTSHAFARAAHDIWCFREEVTPGQKRVGTGTRLNGLAIFPFSGMLRHSVHPAVVLTIICDVCVGVAARDLAPGEELTVMMAPWCFDEAARKAGLEAAGATGADDWPATLPLKENTQMMMIAHFLGRAEMAAWGSDEGAQEDAAEKLKSWLADFGNVRLLQSSPYLRFRAQALFMHLSMGTHHLDDAWDAAIQVMELCEHIPPSEASETAVSCALLGGALAYQQQQEERARKLFAVGNALLAKFLGPCTHNAWERWLCSFVPQPLLSIALNVWHNSSNGVIDNGPPGLGQWDEDAANGSTSLLQYANNIEAWESQAHTAGKLPTYINSSLGSIEMERRDDAVFMSLFVFEGLEPDAIAVDVASNSSGVEERTSAVRFIVPGKSEHVEVPLEYVVDSGATVVRFSRRRRRLMLELPVIDV